MKTTETPASPDQDLTIEKLFAQHPLPWTHARHWVVDAQGKSIMPIPGGIAMMLEIINASTSGEWECAFCSDCSDKKRTQWSYEDLAAIAAPQCPDCGEKLLYIEEKRKHTQ